MSACIVCKKESICQACGTFPLRIECCVCGGSGLSHKNPRKERKAARQRAELELRPAFFLKRELRIERNAYEDPITQRWTDLQRARKREKVMPILKVSAKWMSKLVRWSHESVIKSLARGAE